MIVNHDTKTWGINLAEFEKLGWGSAFGKFKVPNSIIKRFRETYWVDSNGVEYKDKPLNIQATQKHKFDVVSAFNEIAFTYINVIVSSYEILRKTPFSFFEGEIKFDNGNVFKQPKKGSTQYFLRLAVFNAIEFATSNNQLWEKINNSSITTSSFSISRDNVSWALSSDMLGAKALTLLTNANLLDYSWVDFNNIHIKTKGGNVRILGKVSIEELPDLV